MGNIISEKDKKDNRQATVIGGKDGNDKPFVLSDVSKEELAKRRIPVYSYLL